MTWHGNIHDSRLSLNFWVNLCDSLGCYIRLEIVFSTAILESKQTLSDRVAVADAATVNKSHLRIAPAKQIARNLTT